MFRCYSLFSTSNTFNFCLKVFFEKNPFHFFNSKIYITPNLNIKFQKKISLNERGASDKTLESIFFFYIVITNLRTNQDQITLITPKQKLAKLGTAPGLVFEVECIELLSKAFRVL